MLLKQQNWEQWQGAGSCSLARETGALAKKPAPPQAFLPPPPPFLQTHTQMAPPSCRLLSGQTLQNVVCPGLPQFLIPEEGDLRYPQGLQDSRAGRVTRYTSKSTEPWGPLCLCTLPVAFFHLCLSCGQHLGRGHSRSYTFYVSGLLVCHYHPKDSLQRHTRQGDKGTCRLMYHRVTHRGSHAKVTCTHYHRENHLHMVTDTWSHAYEHT